MDPKEIEKMLKEFQEASLLAKKPVTPIETITPQPPSPEEIKIVVPPPVEPIPQTGGVATPAGPCFKKCFKELIAELSPGFIGLQTKDIVVDLLAQIPDCEAA